MTNAMGDSFIKVRQITYERFVFFSSQQQKGESVEVFANLLPRKQKIEI